jgi:hypothetical protein
MKTAQEYMNDPRITNDPGLMDTPEELREIHAIRLKQHDETAGMTVAEKTAYYRQKAAALFAGTGIAPEYVNLSGQGKLKPRQPVTQ